MVDPRELRIGNYITRKDLGNHSDRIEQVLKLGRKKVRTTGPVDVISFYYEIEPIPLTEGLLVKAGFEKKDVTWRDKSVSKDVFVLIPYYVEFTKYGILFCHMREERNHFIREIKYLHQLQNLHWILTGEELTINL